MKKIIAGILLLTCIVSCVKDDEDMIIQNEKENEKTKTIRKVSNHETLKIETDSIKQALPEPRSTDDMGPSDESGEVGPVVTTPPK